MDLLIVARVDDHKGSTLREALEGQVELLRGRGFGILRSLQIPRVPQWAYRKVVFGLRFKISGNLVQDLLSYAVNRINT